METILYNSTRGGECKVTASQAILKGLAEDGGLYVPDRIPKLLKSPGEMAGLTYQEIACEVMKLYFTDFTEEELRDCILRAYDDKFDTEEIAPLAKAGGNYFLELFHGKTIAFKDMALSILPHLMTAAAKKNRIKNEIVILTATSGDTGKAAMEGFADVPGTRILVFYPKNGVSRIQELQMLTQKGGNISVVGLKGNFDDAQTGVKRIFGDREFEQDLAQMGFQLSSANSINIGRLVPQIVYYVYAYTRLCAEGEIKEGEPVNIAVPTGNFGNILAAYFAKQMGLPLGRLICASNDNKVLYDFFRTGIYDRNRDFILTISPSMDILVSSNLERLFYLSFGRDGERTKAMMEELSKEGVCRASGDMREFMADFWAGYGDMEETRTAIRRLYEGSGYLIDPHTAVAAAAAEKYKKETGDQTKLLIVSTASPYKFPETVLKAVWGETGETDEFAMVRELERRSGIPVPSAVKDLENAEIRSQKTCGPEEMLETVKSTFSNHRK